MNVFKMAFCRIYQFFFRIAMPLLPYRKPELLSNLSDIPTVLSDKNIKSVLLVTDKNLLKTASAVALIRSITDKGIKLSVYDDTCPNPTVNNVEQAKQKFVTGDCQCIIAFGGGSPMDCAKAVGAMIARNGKTMSQLKGLLKVRREIPLLIAIPTTAGTGSEVTITAVVTDPKTKHKYTMNDFSLIPRYAVLDANVTRTLPPHLTSTTGMDALTHAVEAYIGRSTTKETRKLAIEAVKMIFENILITYNDGNNLKAREQMLYASYKAGLAFTKSYVGYIHAVAHSLGGQYNIPHGLANAVLMPVVLRMYGKSVYKKLHELAIVTDIADKTDTFEQGAEKFILFIEKLNREMNIPCGFDNINKDDIPLMVSHAEKEANPLYPVPKLMNAEKLQEIYHKVTK